MIGAGQENRTGLPGAPAMTGGRQRKRAEPAIRANPTPPGRLSQSRPVKRQPPRNRRLAAAGPPLTASCMHAAPDVFVILKAGRPTRVARHERASPRGHHSSTARLSKRLVHGDTIMASSPNRHVLPSETLTTSRPPGDRTNANDGDSPRPPRSHGGGRTKCQRLHRHIRAFPGARRIRHALPAILGR